MKYFLGAVLGTLLLTSVSFAQGVTDYHYNPGDALHPFKLTSMVMRPPVALLNIFVKGGYWFIDSEPIRGAFDIEYPPSTIRIDDDY